MALVQTIESDFLSALKNKEENALSTLRMLKAALLNKKIEKQMAKEDILPEEDIIGVIKSEIKKRNDSVEAYIQGNRQDLADKEKSEIAILAKYLPEQLSEEQVRELVKQAIAESGAASAADFGKAMGATMAKAKGQADGGMVSRLVKEELGG